MGLSGLNLSDAALLEMFNAYNGCGKRHTRGRVFSPHNVQDYLKAFCLYKQIILGDWRNGQVFYRLAQMYERGQGVAQDEQKALSCYEGIIQVAFKTQWIYIHALNKLIGAYEMGNGVARDVQKALYYQNKLKEAKLEITKAYLHLYLKKTLSKTGRKLSL
ncbi:SEL1-like repeat protein [Helicobacter suis]|uniref:SEL1-like repeat protein n=1 Tax=Helicobacter suis TaxID=104628 RepID=UPI0013D763E8|nr:SEL1-like repeat protein [Helicobacter suis]